jgi:hypothetical protein
VSGLLGPDGQPLGERAQPRAPQHEHEHEHGHSHADQADSSDDERRMPEVSFNLHVFHLASQVGIALGETENPMTGGRETDLPVARFLIDTLGMLEEKTRNNRTQEEELYIQGVLTNLRMAYVAKSR